MERIDGKNTVTSFKIDNILEADIDYQGAHWIQISAIYFSYAYWSPFLQTLRHSV